MEIAASLRKVRALTLAIVLLVVGLAGAQAGDAAEVPNPVPPVVPALQQWSGDPGEFVLSPQSRVVAGDERLAGEARTFAEDLERLTGQRLQVVVKSSAKTGDLVLALGDDGPEHPEGYVLSIGETVTITARDVTGIARGTQTVEQLFALDARRVSIPRGAAVDWPRADRRGFMLDLGRKYYEPSYVEQQIRTAAWYKLDTVHLHLTEWNAFRLDSPKFPGLAAEQAYTREDVERFEAVAAKYHVTIVAEIDLPAHATQITRYWPETAWECPSMGESRGHNFNVDVTEQATRDAVKALFDEFVPWFQGPVFHIGTDEYPYRSEQEACPELVEYAKENGFANTDDVMVDFINYMNSLVRSHGKTAQAWGWWDAAGDPTTGPDKNILVEAYGDDVFADGTAGAQHFLDEGYDVLYADGNQLYVTPGLDLLPDNQSLYTDWPWLEHSGLSGYMLSRWSDDAETDSDLHHDWFAHRAQQVIADRAWGAPADDTHLDLENRADLIGPPPGVTDGYAAATPDAVRLTGTAYGTSPAFDPATTHDKAFDGDPATFFDYSQADGGYAGIDVGRDVRVSKVRILPRSRSVAHRNRMVGGKLQGCTHGPDEGCVDLATVTRRPPGYDWLQLPVHEAGTYRWLRYLSPDGGFANVAEVEFYTAPQRDVSIALAAPDTIRPLGEGTVRATVTNTGDQPVQRLDVSLLAAPAGGGERLPVQPVGRTAIASLPSGATRTVSFSIDVPLSATAGDYRLTATGTWRPRGPSTGGILRSTTEAATFVPAAVSAELDGRLVVPSGESAVATFTITSNVTDAVTVSWQADAAEDAGLSVQPNDAERTLAPRDTASWTLQVSADEGATGLRHLPVALQVSAGAETIDLESLQMRVSDGPFYLDGVSTLARVGGDWTDYDYSFSTIPFQTGGGGQYAQAGWFFRARDLGNGYAWIIGNYPHSGAHGGNLTKVVYLEGAITSVEVVPLPFDIVAGQRYQVRTVVRGSTVQTYVDDTLVDTTTDTTFTAGGVGFRQDTGERAAFDDVRVTAPDGTLLFADDFDGDLSNWQGSW